MRGRGRRKEKRKEGKAKGLGSWVEFGGGTVTVRVPGRTQPRNPKHLKRAKYDQQGKQARKTRIQIRENKGKAGLQQKQEDYQEEMEFVCYIITPTTIPTTPTSIHATILWSTTGNPKTFTHQWVCQIKDVFDAPRKAKLNFVFCDR